MFRFYFLVFRNSTSVLTLIYIELDANMCLSLKFAMMGLSLIACGLVVLEC